MKFLFALLLIAIQSVVFTQGTIENFVSEGVVFHDKGQYEEAILSYKKALVLEPNSPLVNYELALTSFSLGDYKMAILYSDVVLKENKEFLLQAYMTKGSALDVLGNTDESIIVFEEAIENTGGHYLLYYNLALNYYKLNSFENAEKNVLNAIEQNFNHASSHFMLANIYSEKHLSVQALLAIHYFLFLEPNSGRSIEAYSLLKENFNGNVTIEEDKPNSLSILLSGTKDNEYSEAELLLSLLEASKNLEKNKGKSVDDLFLENTESFFKVLGELDSKEKADSVWKYYINFFYSLANSEHLNTYCKYISQSQNENAQTWLHSNEEKLTEFDNWLKSY